MKDTFIKASINKKQFCIKAGISYVHFMEMLKGKEVSEEFKAKVRAQIKCEIKLLLNSLN